MNNLTKRPRGDDADDIETVPENIDLDDPVQLAIALNAMSKTIFNEEGEQRPRALLMRDDEERSGELDDAAAADKLIDQSHSLHLAPGENRVPLALFMDAYAEELAFPTIYMGVPHKIIGPRSRPFAMASSEIRRTDRRGATPEHVLYVAAKVMRYNVAESNMMFRTNETTGFITCEHSRVAVRSSWRRCWTATSHSCGAFQIRSSTGRIAGVNCSQ
ncbi:hypothetical protein MRX96_056186 [Rhipicephalus microplus]